MDTASLLKVDPCRVYSKNWDIGFDRDAAHMQFQSSFVLNKGSKSIFTVFL